MAIAIGRVVTRVAAALRQDGFTRCSSDLLYEAESGATAVISFQRATGWGAPLTFYVNVAAGPAEYLDFLGDGRPSRDNRARGGFGLWRSRVRPTDPAVQRFSPDGAVDDLWVCHDESDIALAAADLVIQAHAEIIPTLVGLLDPAVALRAMEFRVPAYHVTMDRESADAVLAIPVESAAELRERLHVIEQSSDPAMLERFGPWFRRKIVEVAARPAAGTPGGRTAARPDESTAPSVGAWFIDESDPHDDSLADRPGATIRAATVINAVGTAAPCVVLDLGRHLMIQLPEPAAALLCGDRTMDSFAAGVGFGRLAMLPMRVYNGAPDRIWIQNSQGDATLVARRSERSDDVVLIQLGSLTVGSGSKAVQENDWMIVSVLVSDNFLPEARGGALDDLMAAGRVWGGTVTTTTGTA